MSTFVEEQYKLLKSVTNTEARAFFLTKGYFTEVGIWPGIISASGLENIKLKKIDWSTKNPTARTSAIKITSSKAGKGKRIFGLVHPYAYIHLVNEITSKDLWNKIKTKLTKSTLVQVYSLPKFLEKDDNDDFNGWKYFSIIDLQANSFSYSVQIEIDIQNFYGSIYTHSIPWALLGRDVAKKEGSNYKLQANRLDKLLQNANDGQTNGIIVGNEVSNLIAELILKDIDEKISEALSGYDVIILRYRDDYRLLCKNQGTAKSIVEKISTIMSEEYGLVLNEHKTQIQNIDRVSAGFYKHVARGVLDKYSFDSSENWDGFKLFHFLDDMVVSHGYLNEKNYLDNTISKLLVALKNRDVILGDLGVWAKPIFSLIVQSINNQNMISTFGFALISEIVISLKREDRKTLNNLLDDLILLYKGKTGNLVELWIYLICKFGNKSKALSLLAANKSEIFMIIKNKSADVFSFYARDKISKDDLVELKKFKLIAPEKIKKLGNDKKSFLESIDDDVFVRWTNTIYDR
ncbi:MAG: RNA-directed DNA polymerase [Parcubacteria group bacterium]|jgi:hypothetical protein